MTIQATEVACNVMRSCSKATGHLHLSKRHWEKLLAAATLYQKVGLTSDFPVQKLAETYDLLIIDHPFVGFAAADGCLLPLDDLVATYRLDEFDQAVADQREGAVLKPVLLPAP